MGPGVRRDDAGELRGFPDAAEFLGGLVEHEQRALRDAEIGAVQMQLVLLDRFLHKRKRHQIFKTAEYRSLFDPRDEILHRLVRALLHLLAGLDKHRHPAADEIARRQRLDLVDEGADAAALGMPEHHDVFYLQDLRSEEQTSELQSRFGI